MSELKATQSTLPSTQSQQSSDRLERRIEEIDIQLKKIYSDNLELFSLKEESKQL